MAITERMWQRRFDKIHWRTEGEVFKGELWASRKSYGLFRVSFTLQIGGETAVEIENRDLPSLYWKKDFSTFKAAKKGVIQRFKEIEKLIARTAAKNAEIRQYYLEMLNDALKNCKE